jgi:hypothetical protein
MKPLYQNKKINPQTLLFEEAGIIHFYKNTLFEKRRYQIPLAQFNTAITFSRTYHAPFFIPPVFLSFLAVRLVIKKWSAGDWTLYLGLTVLACTTCGFIYYFIQGKKTGEVELEFGDVKVSLFMQKEDFLELKERLDHLQ